MEKKKGVSDRATLLHLLRACGRPVQNGTVEAVASQLSPATSTTFSLMFPTGTDALMLPPQAAVSRQAGKAKK